ncbi:hypothetical protein [Gracilimonas mengyeensis]|uniref:MetA-pathway of phenol degradation n=1 Tax=Gracilimonas mengyeensis TaxID=1302730 RepID=A0A521AVV2_9BACT|nr:hypothetical protein [Gracilimonas mengyeensis]SMO38914.1 hypothetical protein SAMN06265219_101393 [Gracilimonas mengyeensis]
MKIKQCLTGILLLISGIMLMPVEGFAQDSTMYRITTNDGNHFVGSIVDDNALEIVLKTKEFGEITIQRSNISKMEEYESGKNKSDGYWFENPHPTRYLFGTNAIRQEKGSYYFQNTWVFFNNINAGLTENISLGVGFVPLILIGAESFPIWVQPKVSIPFAKDNLHIAAGGLFGEVIGLETGGFGYGYGIMTVGNIDKNFSLGLGYGFADGEWSRTPYISLGGMLRMTRKMSLVTENYIFSAGNENYGILSVAIRAGGENFAIDYGLIRTTDEMDYIGIPWLGVTIPFGK